MSVEEFVLQNRIKKLGRLFALMVDNYNTMGAWWKNIPLGKEAFELMKRLPERVEGEFDSPAEKAGLLEQMLGQMVEKASPRFCIEVRRYICGLAPDDMHNAARLGMLHDYIDLDYPMDDFCSKYHEHLRFDPVERTPRWEELAYDVERECDRRLDETPRGMGFCFAYWSVKRQVLAEHGVDWKSPAAMNRGVMFD